MSDVIRTSLSIYAWDWSGNVAVRTHSLRGARTAAAPRDVGLDALPATPPPGRPDISAVD